MLTSLRKRFANDDDGFTLIELMVVVLIIAILIAIAIPTFLGAQNRAKDRSAQSDVRNGITNVRSIATDNSGTLDIAQADLITALTTAEPNITFAAAGDEDTVGVVVDTTAETVALYTRSESGTWFGSATDSTGAVYTCKGGDTDTADIATFDTCVAASDDAPTTPTTA